MNLRVFALLCVVCGVAAYPISAFLFPWAQKAGGQQMPDDSVAILSPSAGTWVLKVGILASIAFLLTGIVLFLLSCRRRNV